MKKKEQCPDTAFTAANQQGGKEADFSLTMVWLDAKKVFFLSGDVISGI